MQNYIQKALELKNRQWEHWKLWKIKDHKRYFWVSHLQGPDIHSLLKFM